MIAERIAAFIRVPAPERFDTLAREAFEYQFDRVTPFREMCRRLERTPASVATFRDVPTVPAAAFASVALSTDEPQEIFRSSGTMDTERSVHRHPFPDLYRASIDASFPGFCLPRRDRPPMLALVAPRHVARDSSLGFMIDHVLARFGGPGSDYAFGPRGVEGARARTWLGSRQREGRPVLILATAFSLGDLLDFLVRRDLRFRLPPGSAVFETGGFKGHRKELSRTDLESALVERLAIPQEAIVSEYGMTELTSQCYTATLTGGEPGLFLAPPWMRVRTLDPESLEELPPGKTGLLALFDLANVGSALHLLTEDLGILEGPGFRLLGRAPEADLRGCSLLAEELASGRAR